MFSRAGRWTRTPSATPLQPKKLKVHFWITFNFWWSARLADGLEPHLPPLSSQKNKMLIFGWLSTSGDRPGWLMDWNPICHRSPAKKMKCSFLDYIQLLMIGRAGPWTQTLSTTPLQPKKWNAHFWITFNFWWLAGLVNGLEPHLPPLSSQKNKMLIFGLRSISDDWPGWLMDLNPICHPSPAKKIKCSFLDYIQLLMIGRLVDGLEPHLPPLSSQKNKMLIFGWLSTSGDHPGWSMDSNPISTTLQPKKWNAHFWITFNFWWLAGLVHRLKPYPPHLSSQKNEMLIFGLRSIFGDWPGWSMDSNPICHPSPAKKIKCSFLDYVQFLMIGRAGRWTWTPSATPLQPKK